MQREETPEGAEDRAESPDPAPESTKTMTEGPESEQEGAETTTAEPVEPELVEPEPELTAEEKLRGQLSQAEARLREVSKRFTEQQQEMAEFRGRMENQAKFKAERRAFELARSVFEPVQNLKRSIEMGTDDPAGLMQGLQMVLQQFDQALVKLGMEPVPGVGSAFNPQWHEALAQTPVQDPAQDGVVLMVHLDGYMVGGKVLQAAQVIVGKYQAPDAEV